MAASNNQTRVLLIDDDERFCELISDYLKRYGYEVCAVHNGSEGLKLSMEGQWHAIILDVMLPGMDGFEILQKMRDLVATPVLMLTSLGEETDRIVGLELGADDYLPKTSSPRELLARIRAVVRRSTRTHTVEKVIEPAREIVVGTLCINQDARVAHLADEPLSLTPVEFDLIVVLAQARGRVKSREDLLNAIRDRNYDVYDRSIDMHISSLRKKLRDDPKNPKFIRTIRAAGYMLAPQNEKT